MFETENLKTIQFLICAKINWQLLNFFNKLFSIQNLFLSNNFIYHDPWSNIDLQSCPLLEVLEIECNRIPSVSIPKLEKLQVLTLSNNEISAAIIKSEKLQTLWKRQ